MVNELILDKSGQKMSKSKGNVVDPFMIVSKYGADLTRWYLTTTSPPWRTTAFDESGLVEVQRKFFGTLINTYSFFALYANIDNFSYKEEYIPYNERPEIDRWILSSLNSLIKSYTEDMDAYDITKASRSVSEFTINQLSNWYVRRNRRRFWKSEIGKDKFSAYQTLYECLLTVSKLAAPFAPFISEEIYQNLNNASGLEKYESIHLTLIPDVIQQYIDPALEEKMDLAQRIVSLVRKMRAKSNLKVRQPLQKILIPTTEKNKDVISLMSDIIKEEINVKDIEFVSDDSSVVVKRVKPNFKSIGPKFGKMVKPLTERIKSINANDINRLDKGENLTIEINGESVILQPEDVEILHEDIPGWLVDSEGELTVALDINLNEDLINEGLAREFVNRVQNLRKENNLEVIDRIIILYEATPRLENAISSLSGYIMAETLTQKIEKIEKVESDFNVFEIDDQKCNIHIRKV
jgi:isoleucyl-tRNA synthetase